LNKASTVSLVVNNAAGQQVRSLITNQEIGKGLHQINFEAVDLPTGIYYCTLTTENGVKTIKLMLN